MIYGFITGPALISLVLTCMFYLIPGKPNWIYILVVTVILLTFLTVSINSILIILKQFGKTISGVFVSRRYEINPSNDSIQGQSYENNIELGVSTSLRQLATTRHAGQSPSVSAPTPNSSEKTQSRYIFYKNLLFKLFIVVFLFHLFYQGVSKPIVTNDALIYSFLGKYIAREKSLSNYPMNRPDPETGAKFSWIIHPPGLVSLYAWMHIMQGDYSSDMSSRFVAPIYACYLLILLYYILKKHHSRYSAQLSSIFYILTPVFLFQAIGNSIDPVRITLFTLTAYLFYRLINEFKFKCFVYSSMVLFLACFFHLGNFLLFPALILFSILAVPKLKFRKTILMSLCFFAVIVQYFAWNSHPEENKMLYLVSLNPKYNINEIRRLNAFDQEWQEQVKNKNVTELNIFWQERLQFLSSFERFGVTSYLALIGLCLLVFQRGFSKPVVYFKTFLKDKDSGTIESEEANDGKAASDSSKTSKSNMVVGARVGAKLISEDRSTSSLNIKQKQEQNAHAATIRILKQSDCFFLTILVVLAPVIILKYYLNYRYISTLMPEAVYFAAGGFGLMFTLINRKYKLLKPIYIICLVLLIVCSICIAAIGLQGYNTDKLDHSSYIMRSLYKFSCWKKYTNPIANLCIKISQSEIKDPVVVVTTTRPLPEYFYYLRSGKHFDLNSIYCKHILNGTFETATSCLKQNNISFLLTTPEYSKNPNILKLMENGTITLKDSQRGYCLFQHYE